MTTATVAVRQTHPAMTQKTQAQPSVVPPQENTPPAQPSLAEQSGVVKSRRIEYVAPQQITPPEQVQPTEPQTQLVGGLPVVPVDPRDLEIARLQAELEQRIAATPTQAPVPPVEVTQPLPSFDDTTKQQLEELAAIKRQQRAAELLKQHSATLENLDPEQAAEITNKLLMPVIEMNLTEAEEANKRMSAIQAELESLRQQQVQPEQVSKQIKQQQVDNSILTAHPDFLALRETPEFKAYSASRLGSTSITVGQMLAHEYTQGNAQFVIDTINQYKASQPSIQSIASVPMSGSGVQQPVPQAEQPKTFPPNYLADLNYRYLRKEISLTQYKEALAEYRSANQ